MNIGNEETYDNLKIQRKLYKERMIKKANV